MSKECVDEIRFSHSAMVSMFNVVQQDLFSSSLLNEIRKSLDPLISAKVGRFGIDINDKECAVLESILKMFSATDFKGNFRSISKNDLRESYSKNVDLDVSRMEEFPRIRFTQKSFLEGLNISRRNFGGISRSIEALNNLSSKNYTFFYSRKSLDENGNPVLDAKGNYVYEHVMASGTLITLLRVEDEGGNRLKNYEVILNPLFFDEREDNFLVIPSDWRDEVSLTVGKRKVSRYVFRLLLFLRYIHEFFSKEDSKRPYVLELTLEEISFALKIPENIFKKQKKRTRKILEECYFVAKSTGYLTDFEIDDWMHKLVLNEKKYFNSGCEGEKKLLG